MITFDDKGDFFRSGLEFQNFFEESLFDYVLVRDGFLLYEPAYNWICDKNGMRLFQVSKKSKKVML